MKIALIGYGKMGKTIERIALERGHEIVSIIDVDNQDDFTSVAFKSAEVAIEFTSPKVCLENYHRCLEAGVPLVSGTTGWTEKMAEVVAKVENCNGTFFWASNFSLGVNIFMSVNRYLAKIMNDFPQYDVSMKEVHHIHKLDSPSGTSITLANEILADIERKDSWTEAETTTPNQLKISSERRGEVAGIHTITYESDTDSIEITHDAKGREGFALGAVVAAEFCKDKKGVLGMSDLLKF